MNQLLLTTNEAAHILCVGRSRVYQLINSGELGSVKIGNSRRVPAEAVEQYVNRMIASWHNDAA